MREAVISNLEKKTVKAVIAILAKFEHPDDVIELADSARSARDASNSLNVAIGAIVKTLVFEIVNDSEQIPVVALIAGDKRCKTDVLPRIFNIDGFVVRPTAHRVKEVTGYSIGGVSPVGLPRNIGIIIDKSLKRFDRVWSAAGHTHCVFPATVAQLIKITNARASDEIT